MKKLIKTTAVPLLLVFILMACKKDLKQAATATQEIPAEILEKLSELGFNTNAVQKLGNDYLIEGDILLSPEQLDQLALAKSVTAGNEEQYRAVNIVCGLPRVITVSLIGPIAANARYVQMVDAALARFNAAGLQLTFQRVATGGFIKIGPAPSGVTYLALSGFPVGCNPYNSILLNRMFLDSWNINTCITIVAHEIGHCIGYYHTDHFTPPCGSGTPGPIHIPGTPLVDPNSWMNGCITNGVNRPFTAGDLAALNFLY